MDQIQKIPEFEIVKNFIHILFSNENKDEAFQTALELIVKTPWLPIRPIGGIFLINPNNDQQLELKYTTKNFSVPLLTMCKTVDFGTCICGKAAALKEIKFVDCVNEEHDIRPEGMVPHGHYSVPFFDSSKNILGVIVLYVEHGHKAKPEEYEFLNLIALCLGSLAQRFLYEQQLKAKNQIEMGQAMMATIAHEINNPLMIASGKIQQCLKKSKKQNDDKATENLNAAYMALNRISESVKLLQDLIRETKFDITNYSPDGSAKFINMRPQEEDKEDIEDDSEE